MDKLVLESMILGLHQQAEAIKKETYGKEPHYVFSLIDEITMSIDKLLWAVRQNEKL